MEGLPSNTERTEVGETLPDALERRLVLRLLTYWRSLRGERDFPSFGEIDPSKIPNIWPDCLVLEVADGKDDPVFRVVGEGLAPYADGSLVGHRVSDIAQSTLLGAAVSYFDEVLQKGSPVCRGGEFSSNGSTTFLYRSIILPMSDDGETISGLLVALTCRDVAEECGE